MCCFFSNFFITSINNNSYSKIIFTLNIICYSINFILIVTSLVILTRFDTSLVIKSGYMALVNNILISLCLVFVVFILDDYRKKKIFLREKKYTSVMLILIGAFLSFIKLFTSANNFTKLKRIKKKNKNISDRDYNLFSNTEINKIAILSIFIIIVFFLLFAIWIIYIFFVYKMKMNTIRNGVNNNIYNRTNNSNLSTKADNDNADCSGEIIVKNIDNNKFFYISKNINNDVEKDYCNKETQTIIGNKVKN